MILVCCLHCIVQFYTYFIFQEIQMLSDFLWYFPFLWALHLLTVILSQTLWFPTHLHSLSWWSSCWSLSTMVGSESRLRYWEVSYRCNIEMKDRLTVNVSTFFSLGVQISSNPDIIGFPWLEKLHTISSNLSCICIWSWELINIKRMNFYSLKHKWLVWIIKIQ